MIYNGYDLVVSAAEKKVGFFKSDKIAYFVSSMLAGIYVGLCVIATLIMAGMLQDFVGIKILQGASFAAALSLVVFAGAELFTGNVFVMTAGIARKKVRLRDGIGLCTLCYIGNFVGSALIALLFRGTGYLRAEMLSATVNSIVSKTSPDFIELLIRGVFCNLLVCAAVWSVYRMKSESGKLILIFWAIYLFVICGFEHSIANMTLFTLGTLKIDSGGILLTAMLKNLGAVTLGNIIGGVILSLAYWSISRKMPLEEIPK
ncbi:MAG: formate/nitrite transporter family protein [Oscillospiraceae bacterium]|nr:formate/nitrite transporter family protein [Oscillospiraceae bacterium]